MRDYMPKALHIEVTPSDKYQIGRLAISWALACCPCSKSRS